MTSNTNFFLIFIVLLVTVTIVSYITDLQLLERINDLEAELELHYKNDILKLMDELK